MSNDVKPSGGNSLAKTNPGGETTLGKTVPSQKKKKKQLAFTNGQEQRGERAEEKGNVNRKGAESQVLPKKHKLSLR